MEKKRQIWPGLIQGVIIGTAIFTLMQHLIVKQIFWWAVLTFAVSYVLVFHIGMLIAVRIRKK